jgi:hypothetical protein
VLDEITNELYLCGCVRNFSICEFFLDQDRQFNNRYLAAGGQIVELIRVPLQNPDFAPFLQRARDAAPQALFV